MNEQQKPWRRPQKRRKTLAVSLRVDEHDRIVGQAVELGITPHQLTLRSLRAGLRLLPISYPLTFDDKNGAHKTAL